MAALSAENHRHCKVCGKVCPPEAEICSQACRTRREEILSTRRNYTYLLYGLIAFFLLFLVLSYVRI